MTEEEKEERRKQITNKHIAKLFGQINEVVELPELARQAIIKLFWYLSEDLKKLYNG